MNRKFILLFAVSLMGVQAVRGNEGENAFVSAETVQLTPEQRQEALRVLEDAKKVFAKTGEALDATIEKVTLEEKSTGNDCDECDFLKHLSEKGCQRFVAKMQDLEGRLGLTNRAINDAGFQEKTNGAAVVKFLKLSYWGLLDENEYENVDGKNYVRILHPKLEDSYESAVAHIKEFVKKRGAKWADVQAAFALVNRCHALHYSPPVTSMPVDVPANNENIVIARDNIELASTQPVDPVISPVIDAGSAA